MAEADREGEENSLVRRDIGEEEEEEEEGGIITGEKKQTSLFFPPTNKKQKKATFLYLPAVRGQIIHFYVSKQCRRKYTGNHFRVFAA